MQEETHTCVHCDASTTRQRHGLSWSEAGKLGAEKTKAFTAQVHKEYVERYLQNPKHCKCCGAIIPYEHRTNTFCSSSCSAKFNNEKRCKVISVADRQTNAVKQIRTYKDRSRICEHCGETFIANTRTAKFCSEKCACDHVHKLAMDKLDKYIAETGEFPKGTGMTNKGEANRGKVRQWLEREYGHKCSICGGTEWMGKPIPLVVDHIDGDPLNCRVDNFRFVCGNCDMQLDTYKGKNKGHGRAWRKRYES